MEEKIQENNQPEQNKKEKLKLIAKSAATTIIALAILAAIFYGIKTYRDQQKQIAGLVQRVDDLKKGGSGSNQDGSDQNGQSENVDDVLADFFFPDGENQGSDSNNNGSNDRGQIEDPGIQVDEYAGWKTYTNREIGYKLKYPANWEVVETNTFSELTEQNVKYINIYSQEKRYALHWGLKQINDPFAISDRTGVGAGEFQPDGSMVILNTVIPINKQIFEGDVQEYFFPTPGSVTSSDGKYKMIASFDKSLPGIYEPERVVEAKKILKSVEIIDRNGQVCTSTLLKAEKAIVEGSPVYHSNKYGYLLKYPSDLIPEMIHEKNMLGVEDKDVIGFGDKDSMKIRMYWFSGSEPETIPAKAALEKSEQMKIACADGTFRQYRLADRIYLVASFEKNGVFHDVMYMFTDLGASMFGDNVEMFKAHIKTIEFE